VFTEIIYKRMPPPWYTMNIDRLICRHQYERRAILIDLDEVVEACTKCGKERVRRASGS